MFIPFRCVQVCNLQVKSEGYCAAQTWDRTRQQVHQICITGTYRWLSVWMTPGSMFFSLKQATEAHGGFFLSLTSALDWGWVVNALPAGRPSTHCTEGWVGPRTGLDRCGKSLPHRDSITGPSSPKRVAIPTELHRPTQGIYTKPKTIHNKLDYNYDICNIQHIMLLIHQLVCQ
jgi:hypothetical protein